MGWRLVEVEDDHEGAEVLSDREIIGLGMAVIGAAGNGGVQEVSGLNEQEFRRLWGKLYPFTLLAARKISDAENQHTT